MSNDFIEMINNVDFSYGFIYECIDLVNNLYNHNDYNHLTIKLYRNFVLPTINITKNEHIKEYNEHVIVDICYERYFELSKDEYYKIKKFIDDNIDTFESILAPIHGFIDSYKKCYNSYCYCYCSCGFNCLKNYCKCLCDNCEYIVCKKNNFILKSIAKPYFNVEYIKFFYLLQKVIKLNISNIHSDILKKMFINLHDISNINCNEKVKSKIYDLYREIMSSKKWCFL